MKATPIRFSLLLVLLLSAFVRAEAPKTPDAVVTGAMKAFLDGKPVVVWEMLPESYQKDVQDIVTAAIAKVDPELYNQSAGLVKRMAKLMKDKKKFFLANPMIAEQDAMLEGMMTKHWDAFVGLYETLLESDLATHEKAKAIKVDKFLEGSGGKFMAQYMKLVGTIMDSEPGQALGEANPAAAFFRNLGNVKASVVKQEGDKATVKIEAPDEEAEEVEFVRVEGKWVPADMASEWKDGVGEIKGALAEVTEEQVKVVKAQGAVIIGLVEAAMKPLEDAKTQEEFNAAMDALIQTIAGGFAPPAPPCHAE